MIKKPHPKFNVPNLGAKHRKGVKPRWRKQRGIDNKKRVDKQGYGASPQIGYKNPASIRGMRADGTMPLLVHNQKELEAADSKKTVVFARSLARRKRLMLQKIADGKGIKIANREKT